MARPDLHVFVTTGDGDCCSIGAAHWIHALRYNMNLTVFLHDNQIYGLTKMQASPTSPRGLKSNTTPRGTFLEALQPLSVTLGVPNISFVAQVVDWIPELLYDIVSKAFHHHGLSFVRIVQRCSEWLPKHFEPFLHDPQKILVLEHDDGLTASPDIAQVYKIGAGTTLRIWPRRGSWPRRSIRFPVGLLYRNPEAPCYEDLRRPSEIRTPQQIGAALEAALDAFTVWPEAMERS